MNINKFALLSNSKLCFLFLIMQIKVLLCGTHPYQFNGYSKVVYELSKELCKHDDIKLYIYGFQNFYNEPDHIKERQLPENVEIYDAFAKEEPKNKGFGEKEIVQYVNKVSPDIIIIYNDLIVIYTLIKALLEIPERTFKIVPYIDLVYKNEKRALLKYINDNIDGCIAFTEYWKQQLIIDNFDKPLWTLEHAFNRNMYYPIPKKVARKYFEISNDDFIIMNLNRNQPRKRWDTCIMAYVKFISKHMDDKIKLMVLTSVTGAWEMTELMLNEAKKYSIDINDLKKHFVFIQNPQKLSDKEINIMYNVADVGWNTCDGEGFGLCNFEQAAVGVPQVIPHIGGFKDFFTTENSIPIEPKFSFYNDSSKDVVGGELELCDINDYVAALEKYYTNRELLAIHGKQGRKDITEKYIWKEKADHLRNIVVEATKDLFPDESPSKLIDGINALVTVADADEGTDNDLDIDIDVLIEKKLSVNNELKITNLKKVVADDVNVSVKGESDVKIEKLSKDELKILQEKINRLLST